MNLKFVIDLGKHGFKIISYTLLGLGDYTRYILGFLKTAILYLKPLFFSCNWFIMN